MKRQTILYVLNMETPDAQISDAAEAAAQDAQHLICLVLAHPPSLPIYAYGVSPYGGMNIPDNWPELVSDEQKKLRSRMDAIEQLLAKSNASGEVQSAFSFTQEIKHHVARFARVSDVAYFAANLRDTPDFLREAASGVLFQSPIGLRINGTLSAPLERIYVAWDSSPSAASAAHAALPYLIEAREVMIGCIDPVMTPERDGQDPGSDLAGWLSHHGCKVTVSPVPSGGRNTSDVIKENARAFGADLVVMGAYGHARMIQTVLGGTTRALMEQTDMPVLFAH